MLGSPKASNPSKPIPFINTLTWASLSSHCPCFALEVVARALYEGEVKACAPSSQKEKLKFHWWSDCTPTPLSSYEALVMAVLIVFKSVTASNNNALKSMVNFGLSPFEPVLYLCQAHAKKR